MGKTKQTTTKPSEQRTYYLALYRVNGREYLLCRHKHKSFANAVTCITNRKDLKTTVDCFVYQITEKKVWTIATQTKIKMDGQQLKPQNWYPDQDHRRHYYDGSQMTEKDIIAESNLSERELRTVVYQRQITAQQKRSRLTGGSDAKETR